MIRSFTIEYEHLNYIGTEIIFAESKVDAIKIFMKPVKNELVIIKKISDNGHISTYKGAAYAYGTSRAIR